MKSTIALLCCFITVITSAQQITIVDAQSKIPVSFANISFGNGLGDFADEDGKFTFSLKKYPNVDTLYISAMGYFEKELQANKLTQNILLEPNTEQLNEVIVSAPKNGKFKFRKEKATTHSDIFACWLPTIESEIAVLFKRQEGKSTQIAKLLIPINSESDYKSKSKKKGKGAFSTLLRLHFYNNQNGLPGEAVGYENVVFSINENQDKVFELDVLDKALFIPENGLFVAIQVLGYTNSKGKLLQNKKYREIKTARGIQKISTSFRPLLPFTDQLNGQHTYVRRVFQNNRKWQIFDITYNEKSQLIQSGHKNYGMGAEFKVWED